MGVYRIPAEAIERRERKSRIRALVAYGIYLAFSLFIWPFVQSLLFHEPFRFSGRSVVGELIVGSIIWACFEYSPMQAEIRKTAETFDLKIAQDRVSRRTFGLPFLVLPRDTIEEAMDRGRHGIRLLTGTRYRVLDIPKDIENYETCRQELLNMGIPFRQAWSLTENDGRMFSVLLAVPLWATVFLAHDLRWIVTAAGALLVLLTWEWNYTMRSPNVRSRNGELFCLGAICIVVLIRVGYVFWHAAGRSG